MDLLWTWVLCVLQKLWMGDYSPSDGSRCDGVERRADQARLLPERWHEIDFVLNRGSQKVYIQSAFSIHDAEKHQQEILPLLKHEDSFRKLVVTGGNTKMHTDEKGISYVGINPFLLEEIDNLL